MEVEMEEENEEKGGGLKWLEGREMQKPDEETWEENGTGGEEEMKGGRGRGGGSRDRTQRNT